MCAEKKGRALQDSDGRAIKRAAGTSASRADNDFNSRKCDAPDGFNAAASSGARAPLLRPAVFLLPARRKRATDTKKSRRPSGSQQWREIIVEFKKIERPRCARSRVTRSHCRTKRYRTRSNVISARISSSPRQRSFRKRAHVRVCYATRSALLKIGNEIPDRMRVENGTRQRADRRTKFSCRVKEARLGDAKFVPADELKLNGQQQSGRSIKRGRSNSPTNCVRSRRRTVAHAERNNGRKARRLGESVKTRTTADK